MKFRFYTPNIPFVVKLFHNYFFITALLALVILMRKQNFIEGITQVNELQLFQNQQIYSNFFCLLKGEVRQLVIYYKVDFIFMYGYLGWMGLFVVILNKLKRQHYLINTLLILTMFLCLFFDIYENVTLLRNIPSPYEAVDEANCFYELPETLSRSLFSNIHYAKYIMAFVFFMTLIVSYILSRIKVMRMTT